MEKLDLLFIRACKSADSEKRILSVYRRFYHSEVSYKHLCFRLSTLCSKFNLLRIEQVLEGLSPDQAWKYGGDDRPYYEQLVKFLVSEIRLTEISKFPYYPVPAKHKEGSTK